MQQYVLMFMYYTVNCILFASGKIKYSVIPVGKRACLSFEKSDNIK